MDKHIVKVTEIFSLDERSLALFRILLGIYLLLDVINRIKLTPAFYSDSGILPRYMVDLSNFEQMYHFQVMLISGSEWFSYLFFGIAGLISLMLIFGFKTRVVTFFAWLFYVSMIIRDPLTKHAGDDLYILMLFWGIFLPLGRCFSIDAFKRNYSSRESKYILSAAGIGLYAQFCLVYIMTGLYKAYHSSWLDGTHLYITFSRFDYVEPLAFLIYPHYELLVFLTHFTLWLELLGPLLLFIPVFFVFFRMVGIVLFTGLQLTIGLTMDVGLFPLVSIAGLLVFIPREVWEWLFARVKKRTALRNGYQASQVFLKQVIKRNMSTIVSYKPFPIFGELVISLLIGYVILWNIDGYSHRFNLSQTMKKFGYALKLDQRWNMFASPALNAKYLTTELEYDDGTVINLMAPLLKIYSHSHEFHHVGYINYRWRIFFSNRLTRRQYIEYRLYTLQYLLDMYLDEDAWQENKIPDNVQLIAHQHVIGERYQHSDIEPFILYILYINK